LAQIIIQFFLNNKSHQKLKSRRLSDTKISEHNYWQKNEHNINFKNISIIISI
jgi:hypothetical protein